MTNVYYCLVEIDSAQYWWQRFLTAGLVSGRRRTPVLTMPMAPPQYEAPGFEPPPYHIAIATAVPDPAPGQHALPLPGFVVQPHDHHAYGQFLQ